MRLLVIKFSVSCHSFARHGPAVPLPLRYSSQVPLPYPFRLGLAPHRPAACHACRRASNI